MPMSPSVIRRCVEPRQHRQLEAYLLRRQRIARLLAQGCDDQEIAQRLGISSSTVGDHRRALQTEARG